MGYPTKLLNENERIILDLKPHWIMLIPAILWTALIVALIVVLAYFQNTVVTVAGIVAGLIAFVILAGWKVMKWYTTEFVLTSQRVVHRHGVFAKTAKDIPLDVINEIHFTQSIFERLCGSGNLIIRSASEDVTGDRFEFVRKPESVQNTIYKAREEEQEAKRQVVMPPGYQQGYAPAAPDIPAQIAQLAQLRDQGLLSPQEFESKKSELLRRM